MKQKVILLILLITCSYFSVAQAQVRRVTVIEELETPASSEGVVKITADPKIKELIGFLSPDTSLDSDNTIKANGFRIQVFMSNDSRTARGEVKAKGNLISSNFQDVKVYESYTPPYWKLFVGDFLTREEAEAFRQKLQRTVPELGKEMYVVQDKINIQLNRGY